MTIRTENTERIKKKIGNNIRSLREAKNLDQEDLAKKICINNKYKFGISAETLNNVEKGSCLILDVAILCAIAEALEVDFTRLIGVEFNCK